MYLEKPTEFSRVVIEILGKPMKTPIFRCHLVAMQDLDVVLTDP
jgi:hypothetical protein